MPAPVPVSMEEYLRQEQKKANLAARRGNPFPRIAALEGSGPSAEWDETAVVAATGFDTVGSEFGGPFGARKVGALVEVNFRILRNGATITAGSSGNISDTVIATLDSDYAPPEPIYFSYIVNQSAQGGGRIAGTNIWITTLAPTATIVDNSPIFVTAMYFGS